MDKRADAEVSSRQVDERTAVLHIGGEVDLYNTPQLKEEIVNLIDGGVRRLVVDLSDARYLDSTALGVLIGGLKRLRERNGELRLASPQPRILKVLEITRLLKVFQVCDSVQQALVGWDAQGASGR